MQQIIIDGYGALDRYLTDQGIKKILLVCGRSAERLKAGEYFNSLEQRLGIKVVKFSDFTPNPVYESAVKGTELFRSSGCDYIAAVGGGSAIDVAKCIKLFCATEGDYLSTPLVPNDTGLLAVPTTAGSGSEATRFSVIYRNGEKLSIADSSCIPQAVLFDPSALETLPLYQKKAAMMDTLCHAIESWWSVNSTEESKKYSAEAISQTLRCMDSYLANSPAACAEILCASNLAGKAINITQTTAGHAMAYKLTTLFGCAHGHSAAMCTAAVWLYMLENSCTCSDPRGERYMLDTFGEIAAAMGCKTAFEACGKLSGLIARLELNAPCVSMAQLDVLVSSVNPERLGNNPCRLDRAALEQIYRSFLEVR